MKTLRGTIADTASDVLNVGRRQFLIGLGGSALALPLLPSLMDRKAYAQAVSEKNFVAFATGHGGAWNQNMYPDPSTLTQSSSYAGHIIRQGPLGLQTSGGVASLSPILSGNATYFTPALAQKMNVIQGFGLSYYSAHNASHLGNLAASSSILPGLPLVAYPTVTIDQVMANSPSFYPNSQSYLQSSIVLGAATGYGGSQSFVWSNINDRTSAPQANTPLTDTSAVFGMIYRKPTTTVSPRTPVTNMVMAAYQRLRQSNRRLSSDDKARLDAHMQQVSELQRNQSVSVSCDVTASAPTPNLPDLYAVNQNPSQQTQAFQNYNQLIALALSCGTCRVAVVSAMNDSDTTDFSSYAGSSWHQDIAHQLNSPNAIGGGPTPENWMSASYQLFFETVFLDLMQRLDALPAGNGTTVLDATLMQWTQECGNITHDGTNIPIITAGGAGGALATGNYVDYRDLTTPPVSEDLQGVSSEKSYGGLMYQQWLQVALTAMGVPRSDYAQDNVWLQNTSTTPDDGIVNPDPSAPAGGYGKLWRQYDNNNGDYPSYTTTFPDAVVSADILNDTPPYLKPT